MTPLHLIPLLTLLAAGASGSREARPVPGDPHRKTILDQLPPDLMRLGRLLAPYMRAHGNSFSSFAIHLNGRVGAPDSALQDFTTIGLYTTIYGIALAGGDHPPIWRLDHDAFDALLRTEVPFELIRDGDGLPELPFPSILITFPDGVSIEGETYMAGGAIRVTSLLVMEEVPGKIWRFMGYEESSRNLPEGETAAFTRGWLDLGRGPLREQLPTYAEKGHHAIWQILLNLFLTLKHGYLAGRTIEPKMPKSSGKVKKFERHYSTRPYTVINLTAATRSAAAERESTDDDGNKRASPVRHTVRGHWRTYWVTDPGSQIIIDHRDVSSGGAYKVARYLPPFVRGSGDPGRREYRVIAPGAKR